MSNSTLAEFLERIFNKKAIPRNMPSVAVLVLNKQPTKSIATIAEQALIVNAYKRLEGTKITEDFMIKTSLPEPVVLSIIKIFYTEQGYTVLNNFLGMSVIKEIDCTNPHAKFINITQDESQYYVTVNELGESFEPYQSLN